MFQLLSIITIITSVLCILYFVVFAGFSYGWIKTGYFRKSNFSDTTVTLIIPARNEENSIAECLDSIVMQQYPQHLLEVSIVDDHSEDGTPGIVKKYSEKYPNIKLLTAAGFGKKAAVSEAISESSAELIITSDADCVALPGWIESIVSFYKKTKPKMIVAPVMFSNDQRLSEKMQTLEFLALMGSTAGSLYFDKAILCNGANLAYPRAVFNDVKGFEGIDEQPSGDDVLLMYKIQSKYKGSIRFLKSHDAIVSTSAKRKLSEFINQRKRWASKGSKMMNKETLFLSLLVYFFSFFLLTMLVLSPFVAAKPLSRLSFLQICLILGGIKCVIDFLLLFLAASFFRRRDVLYLFLPGQLIYLLYVVMVGLLGSRGKFVWKGRNF